MSVRLTLVTRDDCCLCDDMKATVVAVVAETGAALDVVDVDTDATLRARYSDEVPVLLIDGRKAFKYRLTEAELRRRIARAEGDPWWRSLRARFR
jgi:hypothetical protein